MIWLLHEVTAVVVVVLVSVFAVYVQPPAREHPPRQCGSLLIVLSPLSVRQTWRLWKIFLEERLQRLGEVAPRNSLPWPERMKESSAADLQTGNAPRLNHGDETRGEAPRPGFKLRAVVPRALDRRIVALFEPSPDAPRADVGNPEIHRMCGADEDMRKSRRIAAQDEFVILHRSPTHVGVGYSRSQSKKVHANLALPPIDSPVRLVAK